MHQDIIFQKTKNSLRAFARKFTIPCISSATESFLVQHLMKYKAKKVLEIGSACGYSTQCIAKTIYSRNGYLRSFEISHPLYMFSLYQTYQAKAHNITLYHANFLTFPLEKIFSKHTFDFVFIDGTKNQYRQYLQKVLPYCKAGCVIIADDVIKFQYKMQDFYHYITKQQLSYKLFRLEKNDGVIIITIKK